MEKAGNVSDTRTAVKKSAASTERKRRIGYVPHATSDGCDMTGSFVAAATRTKPHARHGPKKPSAAKKERKLPPFSEQWMEIGKIVLSPGQSISRWPLGLSKNGTPKFRWLLMQEAPRQILEIRLGLVTPRGEVLSIEIFESIPDAERDQAKAHNVPFEEDLSLQNSMYA